MQTYVILYSYPTWDPHYRGQRSERVQATSERDALARIRRGEGRYGRCPDAQIVRCRVSQVSEQARLDRDDYAHVQALRGSQVRS